MHWSWFLIAVYEVQVWRSLFSSPLWAALLYVGLFVLVTMHEFGHALACRQVGGQANRIVLWPLGGIAFVSPPPRAGAMLWSIAAGPMVNLLLVPILSYAQHAAGRAGWVNTNVDAYLVLLWLWRINLGLLLFNLLPIYPLDGGQIFACASLVSVRPNPQLVYRDRGWLCRRRRARVVGLLATINLDRDHGAFSSQPGRARMASGAVFENGSGRSPARPGRRRAPPREKGGPVDASLCEGMCLERGRASSSRARWFGLLLEAQAERAKRAKKSLPGTSAATPWLNSTDARRAGETSAALNALTKSSRTSASPRGRHLQS